MLYSIKKFWLAMLLLVMGAPSVFGFATLGPYESWQVPDLGFNLVGDDGGPKDVGNVFRWNTRTVFYACDESYADYFGSNGIAAIDQAFTVFNNLTNYSSFTNTPDPVLGPNLKSGSNNLVPLSTSRINFTAEALGLQDVKSVCMSQIINLLGVGEADRYVWNLHNRFHTGTPPCPAGMNYIVVQRNFDPATQLYSSYVNGILYDYVVLEGCNTTPNAYAQPIAVDPTAQTFATVADGVDSIYTVAVTWPGRYFTGLTKDDVGALRYLMSTNRIDYESVATNVLQLLTNPAPQVIVTSNLALFYAQALTNQPAAFQALYPDLIITSTNFAVANVVTTNVTAVVTNPPPPSPAGEVVEILVTNFTTNVQQVFSYTFANLVIYTNFPNSFVTTQTTAITPKPLAPPGTLQTNPVSSTVIVPNLTNGAFYILPANLCGGFVNIKPQLTNVISITNAIPIINPSGATNISAVTASIITYFTNYILVANPVQCATNSAEVLEGVDHINFQRVAFDSVVGVTWGPVTNIFQLTAITNSTPVVQTFRRVVTRPDILISALDGINGPANPAPITEIFPSLLNYNASVVSFDTNGPGTIEPTVQLLFTKGGGPIFFNSSQFLTKGNAGSWFQWASFDGTTNTPIIYPSTASFAGLESQIFFQISTSMQLNYSLSGNNVSNPFSMQLQANGGAQPYSWVLAPGSPGLPPGLTLSTGGVISGTTTASAGTVYDFVVQATDSSNPTHRVTQANLFITITQ